MSEENTSNDPTIVERIDRSKIQPLNDPNCKHEIVKDETDETDEYVAYGCKHCPLGFLQAK